VLPLVERHWTGAARRLARAAEWQAEAAVILDAMGRLDVQTIVVAVEHHGGMLGYGNGNPLSVAALLSFDSVRRRNALRAWINEAGLPMPTARHVWHIEHDVLRAAVDAEPLVRWPGAEVRRYRDQIFIMQPAPEWDSATVLPWDLRQPLALPTDCTLRAQRTDGAGLAVDVGARGDLSVRFRRGGERCKPVGRAHTYTLKHLYQAAGVPPWIRDRTPLIYIGERLAAVPGLCVCEPFGATERGWVITCEAGGAAG
jgi:tRNA(Ile)-lysidine synthase